MNADFIQNILSEVHIIILAFGIWGMMGTILDRYFPSAADNDMKRFLIFFMISALSIYCHYLNAHPNLEHVKN